MGMLKINGMTMYIDDEEICTDQSFEAFGVCGVMGKFNKFRDCFISEFTTSLSKYIPGLNVKMEIKLNGKSVKYKSFKSMLNSYTLFNAKDKVEDILYFVNKNLAEEVIDDFLLEKYRHLTIGELTPSVSNILEMAISVCSRSKIIYCYENLDPYKSTEFYVRILKKYSLLNDSVIFIEANLFDRELYDSSIVFKDNSISHFRNEIDLVTNKIFNITEHDTFIYNSYISRFDMSSQAIFRDHDDLSTDKSLSCSSTDTSFLTLGHQDTNIGSLKRFLVYKHKLCFAFLKFLEFFVPDFSKAFILTNTKFNRPSISKSVHSYYANLGNITMCIFICKHWISLHVLFLQFALWFIYYSVCVTNTPLLESYLNSRNVKTPVFLKKSGSFLEIVILCFILKYLMYFEAYTLLQGFNLFRKEYFRDTSIVFYRIVSSIAYYFIFTDSSYCINEDYTFIKKYLNKSFSSSTYYFHFIIYTFFSSVFPIVLASFILNIKYLYLFSLNALFTLPLLNLFRHPKFKAGVISSIIAMNLVYPLKKDFFRSQWSYKILDAFDPFTIIRNIIVCGIDHIIIVKLACIYFAIFLIFCSLL